MPRTSSISSLGELRRRSNAATSLAGRCTKRSATTSFGKLREGGTLFPGIVGYDETVVPQLVNALLSQHNFILLGLRGQAKTRLLRALVTLLDDADPGDAGLRDQRRSARSDLRGVPRPGGAGRRRDAGRLAAARLALRREAGDTRRDHRRHGRRHRSDQGGARPACSSRAS